MSKKSAKPRKKTSGKRAQYTLSFTRKKLVLWLGIALLVMVWMFVLGVLVGRDLSPVRFDVKKLKEELIALKQKALQADQANSKREEKRLSEDPDLGFYKVLTDKKEEARLKFAETDEPSAKPGATPSEAAEANKKVQVPLKSSEIHKRTAKPDAIPQELPEPNQLEGQGLLTIQVASFNDAQQARQMVSRLKGRGYDAYEITVTLPEKGTYHRVRVGHFMDSNAASRVAANLKREKFEVMIVRE
jgi:cell division septation protein DedD